MKLGLQFLLLCLLLGLLVRLLLLLIISAAPLAFIVHLEERVLAGISLEPSFECLPCTALPSVSGFVLELLHEVPLCRLQVGVLSRRVLSVCTHTPPPVPHNKFPPSVWFQYLDDIVLVVVASQVRLVQHRVPHLVTLLVDMEFRVLRELCVDYRLPLDHGLLEILLLLFVVPARRGSSSSRGRSGLLCRGRGFSFLRSWCRGGGGVSCFSLGWALRVFWVEGRSVNLTDTAFLLSLGEELGCDQGHTFVLGLFQLRVIRSRQVRRETDAKGRILRNAAPGLFLVDSGAVFFQELHQTRFFGLRGRKENANSRENLVCLSFRGHGEDKETPESSNMSPVTCVSPSDRTSLARLRESRPATGYGHKNQQSRTSGRTYTIHPGAKWS
mmetsp:Transcript_11103/g.21433  ORF Transcript_11103/g.21433 Transcript_11103/m.21433 type:complete len:385 (+) Transcript_11103:1151-2305(+)